jgi:hypothetical protein
MAKVAARALAVPAVAIWSAQAPPPAKRAAPQTRIARLECFAQLMARIGVRRFVSTMTLARCSMTFAYWDRDYQSNVLSLLLN